MSRHNSEDGAGGAGYLVIGIYFYAWSDNEDYIQPDTGCLTKCPTDPGYLARTENKMDIRPDTGYRNSQISGPCLHCKLVFLDHKFGRIILTYTLSNQLS